MAWECGSYFRPSQLLQMPSRWGDIPDLLVYYWTIPLFPIILAAFWFVPRIRKQMAAPGKNVGYHISLSVWQFLAFLTLCDLIA